MSQILRKLVAGGPGRPTRLHTEDGHLAPLREYLQIPRVTAQYVSRRLTGKRPAEPWWPTSVIPVIERRLTPRARVIEFGSGGSTLWLARRAASVFAIEDNRGWYDAVVAWMAGEGVDNIELKFAPGIEYYDLKSLQDRRFDLAVIDGSYRWRCIQSVLPLMAPGGLIYLDNSDADKDLSVYPNSLMRREAQRILEDHAAKNPGSSLISYSGMISGELHAGSGMILTISP